MKIDEEIENMKVASKFVHWTFNNLVTEVEDIIESDKQIKHSHIQRRFEGLLDKPDGLVGFLKKNEGVQQAFLEYPLPLLIQSGETYTLNKFNVQSDANKLTAETVYINVCGKYKDMNAMASRTYLVNPKEQQKKAYIIACEALDVCI